jgi:putative tricarboxylic transport membrane protein
MNIAAIPFFVWIMFASGVVGYVLVKHRYPLVSMLLGVVLGGLAETNFRRALRIADASLMTSLRSRSAQLRSRSVC